MKLNPWYLAALTPFAVLDPSTYAGHFAVLVVTFGIFFGTLSLGGSSPSASSPIENSTSS